MSNVMMFFLWEKWEIYHQAADNQLNNDCVQFYLLECGLSVAILSMTTEPTTIKHNETSVPNFAFKLDVEFGV